MEKLRYPYEQGMHGINFAEILVGVKGLQTEGHIPGESGADLTYVIRDNYISICDTAYPDRHMVAEINERIAQFNIQTRSSPLDTQGATFPWEVHPDMFACEFVRIALNHFRKTAKEPIICRGTWEPGSNNYSVYIEQYEEHGDTTKAAEATPSGKIFTKNGFKEIYVRKFPIRENGKIEVDFREKSVPLLSLLKKLSLFFNNTQPKSTL